RAMKSGSSMSKKPKLYDTGSGSAGSSTTMALWPKRSKKISPGSMVATPMRGAACASGASSRHSASSAVRTTASRAGDPFKAAPAAGARAGRAAACSVRPIPEHGHVQRVQPARVGAGHAEAEAAEGEFLAGLWQVADGRGDQAADGVVLVVVEVGAEAFVEVVDRGQRVDHVLAVGLGRDQRLGILGVVVLVVDLADDLLQHVLDRDQAGDAAV